MQYNKGIRGNIHKTDMTHECKILAKGDWKTILTDSFPCQFSGLSSKKFFFILDKNVTPLSCT